MRVISLLSCLVMCALVFSARGAETVADAPPVQLVLELADGSRIIGTPSIDRLKMATGYAEMDVALSQLRTIEFSKQGNGMAQVKLQNGDVLNAKLAAREIALKTIFGEVTLQFAQVVRIRVVGRAGALPEGLVLHYTFDTDEDGKVTDASGSGNDGVVRDATYTKDGKQGGAMGFNGLRQAVVVKKPTGLELQDFSIMAWIKRADKNVATKAGYSGLIFGYGQGGYGMGIQSSGVLFLTKVGIDNVSSEFQIDDEAFHHVAVTKKGNKVVLYLDGVPHPTRDYNVNFEFNTGVSASCRMDLMIDSFFGLIDELAVFNRGLSEDEVKGIYEAQK